MTEIRAEAIWAVALSNPLRVRILRHMLWGRATQPVELARMWGTTTDAMHRHFRRLRELGVVVRADGPETRGRVAYDLRNHSATKEALWRLGAPLPDNIANRFALRESTTVASQQAVRERLRARREELGLSRGAVARRTGLRESMLARIERGQVNPRLSTVLVLADELDYPPEQLFTGAASPQAETCR